MDLPPETMLSVRLSAIMGRHRYDRDPAIMLDELTAAAGDRMDVLAREAGIWVGYYGSEHTAVVSAALRSIPGAQQWVATGVQRRSGDPHQTPNPRHFQ